jgi:hypothetical protein
MGLIAQMIEALSFVLLLHDFNMEDLVMRYEFSGSSVIWNLTTWGQMR